MPRLLFLSHSGIDTEAAKALKARITAAPAAREHGLNIWFDKDDLRAGEPWQSQLEEAIGISQAFAVYVGSKGVVNWVEAEVRLGLSRAITEPDYRFVPILAGTAPNSEALPGFARQFQGVADVEAKPEQFDRLMRAVLGGAEAGQLQLETEPFFGLRAIDESRSHLFFGRKKETEALVALVHRMPLVLVTGDSGSGKSSLVRAGLVPRFRGGALALLDDSRPGDTIWHVVTTRPRNQPFRQLGDAVDEAAKDLGLSLADRGTLADWAASGELDKVRRGLRCDLSPERVQVLLVVDQFEELLTITPPELRGPFIDLLLELSDPAEGRHKVVLTMRHDYANLCNAYERLKTRLDGDDRRARFLLGRMSDEGLRQIVAEPLRLARIETADREALASQVLRDVGERPGDLALVQMALTETWHARAQHGGNLLRAYADVGRVEGALAKAAEHVRTKMLGVEQRGLLVSILLRLVRLGDTGGATRRVASCQEFDDARWSLVQKLASEQGKRLVLLRGSAEQPTVEIAHEALVTAWPYFQNLLQETADDKRILDALIPRAQAWAAQKDESERAKRLAVGADLEFFAGLLDRRGAWLSGDERGFIDASTAADHARRERDSLMTRGLQQAAKLARANESRALAALSEVACRQGRYIDAVKLALAAWPRSPDDDRPRLRAAINALGAAEPLQRQMIPPLRHEGGVRGAAFSRDGSRILTWSDDKTARLWDAATASEILQLRHESHVFGATFSRDESRILTWSDDKTARLWDAASGKEILQLRHEDGVKGAAFSRDESRILTSSDKTARLWDAATGREILQLRHEGAVSGATFSRDESRILTWSDDKTARLWDAATGREILQLRHERHVFGATFSRDESRILTWSGDGTARLWDAATGREILQLRHEDILYGAAFSRDESRILTRSRDKTGRLWDAATGKEVFQLRHESDVTGATFSRDESRILTRSFDKTVRLWDVATGKEVLQLRHEDILYGAAFSRDESRILTRSRDKTVRLWDVATGKEVLQLRHESDVSGAAFSRDESRILTRSLDKTVRLWDISRLPPGNLINVACGLLPDHDTSELKDRYGIAITEPICGPDTPAPVWTELED
jgi:WD40 repeat protein